MKDKRLGTNTALMDAARADTVSLMRGRSAGTSSSGDADTVDGYHASDFLSPTYLVISLDSDLTNERRFLPGDHIDWSDGGTGGNYMIDVDLSQDYSWTGTHSFSGHDIQLDGDLDFVGAQSITTTAGNLTITPAGDLVLDPTGNDVYPSVNYDLNLGMLTKKFLTIHAAELWVQSLVAQETIATIGGNIWIGPSTTELMTDLGSGDLIFNVKHNQIRLWDTVILSENGSIEFIQIDGLTITSVDTTNDYFLVSGDYTAYFPPSATFIVEGGAFDGTYTVFNTTYSGGSTYIYVNEDITGSGSNGYITLVDNATGYTYFGLDRNKDGSGANSWPAGAAVFNSGYTGDGFIEIYAIAGVVNGSTAGPTIVGSVRNSATYNDISARWAIGNLNGLYGYSSDTYGSAFGDYAGGNYLVTDEDGLHLFAGDSAVTIDENGISVQEGGGWFDPNAYKMVDGSQAFGGMWGLVDTYNQRIYLGVGEERFSTLGSSVYVYSFADATYDAVIRLQAAVNTGYYSKIDICGDQSSGGAYIEIDASDGYVRMKGPVRVNNGLTVGANFDSPDGVGVFGEITSHPTFSANAAAIYAYLTSGSAEMWVKDEAGNTTQISPHDPETGEWIFYSENIKTGQKLRVEMEKLVAAVEELTGRKFAYYE